MRASFVGVGVVAALGVAGCGPAPHTRAAGALSPLTVKPVDWNPGHASLGRVNAVADSGTVVAVFGDGGASVLSSGAVVATDRSVTSWASAGTIPGADGSARWIVGVDAQGRLHYLHGLSRFDDVSSRYGLDAAHVHDAAAFDGSHVGFLLDGEVAIADGQHVTHYATGPLRELTGGGGTGAGMAQDGVVTLDAKSPSTRTFPLENVTHVAVGADGRVYATTARALYGAGPDGSLSLLYVNEAGAIHGLVASGDQVWFADGSELGVVDGAHVAETTGAGLPVEATLAASPSGDVWVLAGGGLQRFSRVGAGASVTAASTWSGTMGPIFARVCASCHQPGGSSGTDLSTAGAWEAEREAIRQRVVVSRTMPPEGHPLLDSDRAAIAAWLGAPAAK